jgi:hypothetical protein
MIFYLARPTWAEITKVEVSRVTASSIFFIDSRGQEQRRARQSSFDRYFETWGDAHDYMVECANFEIEQAQIRLDRAHVRLEKIKALTP